MPAHGGSRNMSRKTDQFRPAAAPRQETSDDRRTASPGRCPRRRCGRNHRRTGRPLPLHDGDARCRVADPRLRLHGIALIVAFAGAVNTYPPCRDCKSPAASPKALRSADMGRISLSEYAATWLDHRGCEEYPSHRERRSSTTACSPTHPARARTGRTARPRNSDGARVAPPPGWSRGSRTQHGREVLPTAACDLRDRR